MVYKVSQAIPEGHINMESAKHKWYLEQYIRRLFYQQRSKEGHSVRRSPGNGTRRSSRNKSAPRSDRNIIDGEPSVPRPQRRPRKIAVETSNIREGSMTLVQPGARGMEMTELPPLPYRPRRCPDINPDPILSSPIPFEKETSLLIRDDNTRDGFVGPSDEVVRTFLTSTGLQPLLWLCGPLTKFGMGYANLLSAVAQRNREGIKYVVQQFQNTLPLVPNEKGIRKMIPVEISLLEKGLMDFGAGLRNGNEVYEIL